MPARSSSALAPDFKTTPYWWEEAPPESAAAEPVPETADVAVVGSGYCGLSCAIELADAGADVVVLEARALGHGASTRSGGMVTGGQKFVVSGAITAHSKERQARILEDAKSSLDHIEALIVQHGLDAGYERNGRLILAETPAHFSRLESWARALERHAPGTVSLIARERLGEEIGGCYYYGGLLISNYGGLHPARYHRSLRELARRRGVRMLAHTPVERIERAGGGHVVVTSRGRLAAKSVFVATNGYSGDAEPFLKPRVIPAASYIIATEPLPEDLARHLSPRRRMFSDSKRSLCYFRLSPDGTRVVFGTRVTGRAVSEREAAPLMRARMLEIWPQLAPYRISHCWTGNVAMTFDHVPHMGTHEGVHYAVGCNGSGVTMMTYLGHQTALKLLGRQNRPSAFDTDVFPKPPFYSGKPWFVPIVTWYYLARDRLDRWMIR